MLLVARDHAGETPVAVVEVDRHPPTGALALVAAGPGAASPSVALARGVLRGSPAGESHRAGRRGALLHHRAPRFVAVGIDPLQGGADPIEEPHVVRVGLVGVREVDLPVVDVELLDDPVVVPPVELEFGELAGRHALGVATHL
nr:hypothetical protein [Halorubrum saccharovorum]